MVERIDFFLEVAHQFEPFAWIRKFDPETGDRPLDDTDETFRILTDATDKTDRTHDPLVYLFDLASRGLRMIDRNKLYMRRVATAFVGSCALLILREIGIEDGLSAVEAKLPFSTNWVTPFTKDLDKHLGNALEDVATVVKRYLSSPLSSSSEFRITSFLRTLLIATLSSVFSANRGDDLVEFLDRQVIQPMWTAHPAGVRPNLLPTDPGYYLLHGDDITAKLLVLMEIDPKAWKFELDKVKIVLSRIPLREFMPGIYRYNDEFPQMEVLSLINRLDIVEKILLLVELDPKAWQNELDRFKAALDTNRAFILEKQDDVPKPTLDNRIWINFFKPKQRPYLTKEYHPGVSGQIVIDTSKYTVKHYKHTAKTWAEQILIAAHPEELYIAAFSLAAETEKKKTVTILEPLRKWNVFLGTKELHEVLDIVSIPKRTVADLFSPRPSRDSSPDWSQLINKIEVTKIDSTVMVDGTPVLLSSRGFGLGTFRLVRLIKKRRT